MMSSRRMESLVEQIDILRAGRALADMTQTELSVAAGVSRQMVVRMENREGNVPMETIAAVRKALERVGIVFLPATQKRGPGVARRRTGRRKPKLATPADRQNNEAVNPSEEAACSEP